MKYINIINGLFALKVCRICFLAVSTAALAACSDSNGDTDTDIAADSVFFDEISSVAGNSIHPMERMSVELSSGQIPSLVQYRGSDGFPFLSQVVWSGEDGGRDEFLVIPRVTDDFSAVSLHEGDNFLAQVTIKNLPELPQSDLPGEYSLNAMNSLIFDLRDLVEDLKLSVINPESDATVIALENAIESFQSTIEIIDNVTSFNSVAIDPNDSSVVLNSSSLNLLDQLFLTIFSGFAETSVFLDGAATLNASPFDNITKLNFEEFSEAAKNRLKDINGVKALASLSILNEGATTEVDELKNALEFVQASIVPALVLNWLEAKLDGTPFPIVEQTLILESSSSMVGGSNFAYEKALATLNELSSL